VSLNIVPVVQTQRPSEEWYDHVGGIQQHVRGPTSPCVSFPCLFQILRQQLLPGDLDFLEQQYVSFKVGHNCLKVQVNKTVLLGSVTNSELKYESV
jgi:hypothetical protein